MSINGALMQLVASGYINLIYPITHTVTRKTHSWNSQSEIVFYRDSDSIIIDAIALPKKIDISELESIEITYGGISTIIPFDCFWNISMIKCINNKYYIIIDHQFIGTTANFMSKLEIPIIMSNHDTRRFVLKIHTHQNFTCEIVASQILYDTHPRRYMAQTLINIGISSYDTISGIVDDNYIKYQDIDVSMCKCIYFIATTKINKIMMNTADLIFESCVCNLNLDRYMLQNYNHRYTYCINFATICWKNTILKTQTIKSSDISKINCCVEFYERVKCNAYIKYWNNIYV